MSGPDDPDEMDADARLQAVARILAEGLLRSRLRAGVKGIPATGTRENPLEVSTASAAHGGETSRNGERP